MRASIQNIHFASKQRGVVLLVGLMILLILTVLGLTSSNVSMMQERMAGNVSESNVAFQRAENTLREVEQRLTRLAAGGTGGLGVIPDWSETGLNRYDCTMSEIVDWSDSNPDWAIAPSTGNRYMVINLSDYMDGGLRFGSSCRPVSEVEMNTAGEYFLIVASAPLPSGTGDAIVQSIFYWPQ